MESRSFPFGCHIGCFRGPTPPLLEVFVWVLKAIGLFLANKEILEVE